MKIVKRWSSALWMGCLLTVGCAQDFPHGPSDEAEYDPEVLVRRAPRGDDADQLGLHSVDALELAGFLDQDPLLSALSDEERKDLCGESLARFEDMLREKPVRECKIAAQLSDALDPARCAATFDKCVAAQDDAEDEDVPEEPARDGAECSVPSCAATVSEYRSCNVALIAEAAAYYDAFMCGASVPEPEPALPAACAALMRKCPEALER